MICYQLTKQFPFLSDGVHEELGQISHTFKIFVLKIWLIDLIESAIWLAVQQQQLLEFPISKYQG